MLKMIRSSGSTLRVFGAEDEIVRVGDDKANETIRNLFKSKKLKNNKSRNLTYVSIFKATREPTFLTLDAKEAFNYLRQTFIKALILWHFDPECHIWIETNPSSYAIGGVLSQLSTD